MNRSERIHIPARPLPRRYRRLGLDGPSYNVRHLLLALLACVLVCAGVLWWVLR